MALVTADMYASFDVTAGAFLQDISPALVEAIYADLNLLEAIPLGWDSPVSNVVHIWNEDALNADTLVSAASITSSGTTLTITTGQGVRVPVNGMLLMPRLSTSSTEILQVTAGAATDSFTVTREYNSTTAASYPTSTTFVIIDALQEGSDIGNDTSVTPTVRQNNTHILGCRDLKVSGSQLARKMATRELEDWVGHQLANRTIELKRKLINALLYSEGSSSDVGSDTVYRTMKSIRQWTRASGITDTDSEAMAWTVLNAQNKTAVDLGVYIDTLVIGTDLVSSIAGIDSSVRRLYESDTAVGYTVQEILLSQGNTVRLVIDQRVNPGEAYGLTKAHVRPLPFAGRGMFTIAATDFSDARKRRVLGEWTLQVDHPEANILWANKT